MRKIEEFIHSPEVTIAFIYIILPPQIYAVVNYKNSELRG